MDNLSILPSNAVQLPPQNIEAEEAILGGILLNSAAIEAVSTLDVEAFYVNAHKDIFQAMLRLHQQGKHIDLISVSNWLDDQGLLKRVGGRNKLATLLDRTVTAANIDGMAEIVMEKYHRRKMVEVGNQIAQLGYDCFTELPEAIALSEEKVYSLSQGQDSERYKVLSASDMAIELFDKLAQGKLSGERVGWYDLEEITGGVYPSSLVVVAAESHMGKTHFMMSYAYEMMTKLNKPVLYVSPEMDDIQINSRMLARITGIDSRKIQVNPSEHWEQIAEGVAQLGELPWKAYLHSAPTTQMIASSVRYAHAQFGGVGAVFVDYLQQIPVEGGNLAFEIGKIVRQLRDIAKYYKIPVFLGCQINRGNQATSDKRPNRHLLRNSGEIFEVCDQLIMLYRDAVYSKNESDRTIELIVEKNRLSGKLGTATMLCDLSTSRFLNMKR